jgi:hypothetical protein
MENRDIYEYGWGLKGQRIYGQRPGKRRERISMMSGYHLGKLVAPCTWIGSCNLQVLIAWLTEMLLPTIGAGKKIGEFQLYNGIMLSVVKIDYVKCQKPALNADTKTSSSMDSFSRNRDINAKAVTINSPPPIESVVSPNG